MADDGGDACSVLGTSASRQRRRRRPGQRHGRPRAGLRRHVLRVARSSERAAGVRALLAAGELRRRTGRAPARRLRRWLRNRGSPRPADESRATTSAAGTAPRRSGRSAQPPRSAACSSSTRTATAHAMAIAASEASGLKENFGTMVKPLHAGLAARDGVLAALLARRRHDGQRARDRWAARVSARDGQRTPANSSRQLADLGTRWEILETGITVKLYPSCAGTHPALDAILVAACAHALHRRHDRSNRGRGRCDRRRPCSSTIDRRPGSRPSSACRSAPPPRWSDGRVGIDTFETARLTSDAVATLMPRVAMTWTPRSASTRRR